VRADHPALEPLAGHLDIVIDPDAPPGDVLPPLARLLRKLRDRERADRDRDHQNPGAVVPAQK
jgi:hypothetical protein